MLTVIGIGTQDSFPEAEQFRDRHDVSFPLLWDEGFTTWDAFGIVSQPAAVLMTPDGRLLTGWIGAYPEDEVVRLADELA